MTTSLFAARTSFAVSVVQLLCLFKPNTNGLATLRVVLCCAVLCCDLLCCATLGAVPHTSSVSAGTSLLECTRPHSSLAARINAASAGPVP